MKSFILAVLGLGPAQVVQVGDPPTFSRDIAPIVFENCISCHRSGGSAPFSLETYEDVSRRALQITDVTEARKMPPWLPKDGYGDFAGSRRLTVEEIRQIREWSHETRPGDASEMPSPPAFAEGWQLGKPDLIVSMPRTYTLPPAGHDVYRNFVLPIPIDSPRYVRALEFRPGGPNIVHHARILVDRTGGSRELDARDGEPGYDGMIVDKAEFPDGLFLGWAPGKVPLDSDEALVWRLLPGTDLVVQSHMMTSDKPRTVNISVGLFFTDEAPKRRAAVLQLGSKTIDIAAGVRAHAVEDSYVLPADVDVIGIYPHAHYICREMQVTARLPDGPDGPAVKWLLWIPEWDFYWQDEYRFETPVSLPRGTKITMRFIYDNSSRNPRNPFDPPQRIRFGPLSTDEMGDVLLMVVPREPETLAALQEDFLEKEIRQDIAGYEKMLEENPDDAQVLNALGFAYSNMGRTDDAIAKWQKAVRIRPDYAEAYYNLGGALAGQREYRAGAKALQNAIEANPSYAEAYNNLGVVLQSEGRLGKAIDQYQKAIEIRPDYAFAQHNLGNAFLAEGKLEKAIEHLSAAIHFEPDYAEAHYSLGSALGRQGRLDEEIAHYRRAIEAKPDYAQALHNLGVVLLLAGRPQEAVTPLRDAVRVRPDYGLAYANLARALAALDEVELDESDLMFRKAISLRPEDASAHRDLGAVSTRAGRLDAALTHYHIAVRMAPDDIGSLAGLAWVLAVHPQETTRDAEAAVRLAERASRLAREPDTATLDALAAAYASAGRFDRAVRTAEKALAAARNTGDAERMQGVTERLELYRNDTPYRAP